MENKLIEIYEQKTIWRFFWIYAKFTLGEIKLTLTKGELNRLMAVCNMDRLTREQYK